jgi:hypothetical protein
MFYTYVYLDPRKPGNFIFDTLVFDYEPIYIGKGKNNRMFSHIERSKASKPGSHPFYDKIRKIVDEGFDPIVLKLDSFNEEKESLDRERELIKIIGRKSHDKGSLLNLTDGGIGGDTFSGQTLEKKKDIREKISNSNKGKNKGKKISDDQKEFLRNLYKGKKNPEHSKKMKGKKQSTNHKEKEKISKLKWNENNNPYWNKEIIQFNLKGDYIKTWKNYRELSTASYDYMRIRFICDKKQGFKISSKSLWEWKK